MIDPYRLSRRHFLNLGVAAGSTLLMPPGLIRPARAAEAGAAGLIRPVDTAKPLPPVKEEDAVVAFGHVGPVTDGGWTWSHDQGMKAVQAAFPKAKTLYVESIPYSADATRTFRQFVAQGAQMVFATSNYGDFYYEVTDRAPQTAFFECDGRHLTNNLGTYYVAHWYPTYVLGVAAGLLSKTGKLGYVASFPVSSVFSGTNAFLMGARSVNPHASVHVITINSWFDPQAATQAGTALADSGCDFLFGIMDEAGYLRVAEQRGIWAAMWNTDMRQFGPNAYVTSIVVDFKHFYVDQVRRRLAGTWTPAEYILPMAQGVDRDAWGAKVPAEVRQKADAARDKILAGHSPFVGEIRDASGKVRVKAGETMTEEALYNWDWSIEGVSGLST
jgi:basic membrane protein A and related proteins